MSAAFSGVFPKVRLLAALRGLLVGSVLVGTQSYAEAVHPPALSLDDALRLALARNPQMVETRSSATEARFAGDEAKSQLFPKVSLSLQYSTSDDIRTQLPDSNQALVRVDYNALQGERLLADLQRLANLRDAAQGDVELKKLQVALAVKTSYFRGLSAVERAREWEDSRKEFERLLKYVEPKFTVGSVPEYDFAKIQLSLEDFDREHRKAAVELQHELYTLGERVGGAPPTDLLPLPEPKAPPRLRVEDLVPEIESIHPEAQAARLRAQAQESELSASFRERWPTLKLTADYGYSGFTANDLSLGWGFSASLVLPIFDFGTISSRISQAEARLIAQESRLQAVRLKLRTDLADAIAGVQEAWESFEAARRALPIAERAYRSSLRRYRTGIAPMTELSDAHDLWIRSRITLSQARADYRTALAALETAYPARSSGGSP